MFYSDLLKVIDKKALYRVKDLEISVLVKDMKNSYGQVRYLIAPEKGTGMQWVNAESLKLLEVK